MQKKELKFFLQLGFDALSRCESDEDTDPLQAREEDEKEGSDDGDDEDDSSGEEENEVGGSEESNEEATDSGICISE